MAKANTTWKVLPHRPIDKIDASLWRVQGTIEGMALRRVMTVARRHDGQLVVHNAIALEEASMQEIDAWGPVGFLVVPNGYHRLDAGVFHARYPAARVLCPAGARAKVEQVVPVSGVYEDMPADPVVSLETLDGMGGAEGAMIVRSDDGTTVVLNDAIFNMPHGSGLTGLIFRHLTQSTGGPRVSRVVRWFLLKDGKAFRAHLERLADLPHLRRVIVSHHRTIDEDPARVLRDVAATV